MLFGVHQQGSLRPKRPNAIGIRTDELVHSSVDEHEVIYHLVRSVTISSTFVTNRFSVVSLQMPQKMRSVLVILRVGEFLVANGAG